MTHQSFTPRRWTPQELEWLRESLLGLLEELTSNSPALQVITTPSEWKTLELAQKLLQWILSTFVFLLEAPSRRVGLVPLDQDTLYWLASTMDLMEGDSR